MVTDPLGDFINILKNASAVRKENVTLPYSNFKFAVAEKLKDGGFVKAVSKKGKKVKRSLEVELAYTGARPHIVGVKRISKPGRRLYNSLHDISQRRGIRGIMFLSTPQGILTDKEARQAKVGGEALFYIW